MAKPTTELWAFFLSEHACQDGMIAMQGYETLQEAWEACPRADWAYWVLQRLGFSHQALEHLSEHLTGNNPAGIRAAYPWQAIEGRFRARGYLK